MVVGALIVLVVVRRLPRLVGTLLAVSALTFMMTSLLPGDPALALLGTDDVTPEQLAAARAELGLDEPLPERYLSWLGNAATGDLGRSFRTNQRVVDAITERLPVTVEIGLLAVVVALVVSVPLGVYTAYRSGRLADKLVTFSTFGLLSVPSFMLALLLVFFFALDLGWLPTSGWTRLTADPVENLRTAALPTLALAVGEIATYTRLLRTDMISTLQEDFVQAARAKGLPTAHVLFRHALRPSTLSLVTVVGLNIGTLVGGALIIETIFALPGVGRLLVESIYQRDLLMVQGVVLVIATVYVVTNFVVDVLYSVIDPRIRTGRAG